MLRNLFYVGVLFCLVACKDTNHQETDVRTIEVTDFSGQKQELNELFRTEVLELRSDSSGYVANVKDVAAWQRSVGVHTAGSPFFRLMPPLYARYGWAFGVCI